MNRLPVVGNLSTRFSRQDVMASVNVPIKFGDGDTFAMSGDGVQAAPQINTPDDSPKDALLDELIWVQGASPGFVDQVKNLMRERIPLPLLQDIHANKYSFCIKHLITTGRPDLENYVDPELGRVDPNYQNYSGGLHEPEFRSISIAEYIVDKPSIEARREALSSGNPIERTLIPSKYWQNAILHEVGHQAATYIGQNIAAKILPGDYTGEEETNKALMLKNKINYLGASEVDGYVTVHDAERVNIPNDVNLSYFTNTNNFEKAPRVCARQETFAEAFDILSRGVESTYNHDNFVAYFPRTLKLTYTLIQEHYPDFQAHPSIQAILDQTDATVSSDAA